jgi:Zn-dependent oligopeptidase
MAENYDTVNEFLNKIYDISYPEPMKEIQEMKDLARSLIILMSLWDGIPRYYSELLKKEKI